MTDRMSAADFRKKYGASTVPPTDRPAKYRNEKVPTDDGTFDSKHEHGRWGELQMLERQGEITGLDRQVVFRLDVNGVRIGSYVADFIYRRGGKLVVEDAKGVRTDKYRFQKRLMLAVHGIAIEEV